MSALTPSSHIRSFRKAEHLCLRRDIDALFATGSHSAAAFPLRLVWRVINDDSKGPSIKVLLSVPKRHLRHAVDRNRAKRQLREAYRLYKQMILTQEDKKIHIAFLWLSDKPVASNIVQQKVVTLLHRLNDFLHSMP